MADFIVVDGGEGGTGAAPLEFSDSMGFPLLEGLALVHEHARRRRHPRPDQGRRQRQDGHRRRRSPTSMALGADWCNSARAFMFSVGCIQAQRCHTNTLPGRRRPPRTRKLQRALVVPDKAERVHHFHRNTVHALAEFVAAMGLDHPRELAPHHVVRRVSATQVVSLDEIYPVTSPAALISGTGPDRLQRYWRESTAETFRFDPGTASVAC